ncbi:MAG: 50S ribosomal protein L9 [Thermoanaerobaculia bacterium]|nr:50S ribosomal protein L9 [Thermoanaerobaculia bacterium]
MQVILMQDLVHTGKRGEIIDVKPGYARNYLLPRGLALEATPGNLKVFEQRRRRIEVEHAKKREEATAVVGELAGIRLEIAKRAGDSGNLYGSVTASEIAEALAAKGVQVDRRRIDLEGGIKSLGDHKVRIDLHSEVIAEVDVTVVPEE